jgi:hypothetical protein
MKRKGKLPFDPKWFLATVDGRSSRHRRERPDSRFRRERIDVSVASE